MATRTIDFIRRKLWGVYIGEKSSDKHVRQARDPLLTQVVLTSAGTEVSAIRVTGWDNVIPPAEAGGTDLSGL